MLVDGVFRLESCIRSQDAHEAVMHSVRLSLKRTKEMTTSKSRLYVRYIGTIPVMEVFDDDYRSQKLAFSPLLIH